MSVRVFHGVSSLVCVNSRSEVCETAARLGGPTPGFDKEGDSEDERNNGALSPDHISMTSSAMDLFSVLRDKMDTAHPERFIIGMAFLWMSYQNAKRNLANARTRLQTRAARWSVKSIAEQFVYNACCAQNNCISFSLQASSWVPGPTVMRTQEDFFVRNKTIRRLMITGSNHGFRISRFVENPTLKELILQNNRPDTDEISAFGDALKVNTTITHLSIPDSPSFGYGTRVLGEALKVNQTLVYIDMHDNQIGPDGAIEISDALKVNKTLTSIDLGLNGIRDEGACALGKALKVNNTLTFINLYKNIIRCDGARALAEALKVNTAITKIVLSDNIVCAQGDDQGAIAFGEALKVNNTLTCLSLAKNTLGHGGSLMLSDALKVNTALGDLNLKGNNIGPYGASKLGDALEVNKTLMSLDLSENRVRSLGTHCLAHSLKVNTALMYLNLSKNNIGISCYDGERLAEVLEHNKTLTRLELEDNQISLPGLRALCDALKVNTTLNLINLRGNAAGTNAEGVILGVREVNKTVSIGF